MTNKEKYIELCKNESLFLYNQPWWLDTVCGTKNWDVVLYTGGGEQIIGAMPYYIKSRHGLRYISQPPMTQHNGVWLRYPQTQKNERILAFEKEVVSDLLEQVERLSIVLIQQSLSSKQTNWLPYYWKGYRQSTNYSYVLPTGSVPYDDIQKDFSKTIRYDAKKAKELVRVEETDDLKTFYELNCKTYERQGQNARVSYDYLERFDKACKEHSARKILLARTSDEIACCATYFVFDAEKVYYIMSGTDSQYRNLNALTLLILEGIQFASSTGRDFDFEGSMVENINDYFRKFGAVQIPYFHVSKVVTKMPVLRGYLKRKLYG